MIVTLELTQEESARLRTLARKRETDVETALRSLVADLPTETPGASTIALLQEWREEDARMTPEERAAAAARWEETETNLKLNRLSFPEPNL